MIERGHGLPLARQAELPTLSRSSLYHEPRSVPAAALAIMRRIDALHLEYPFAGSWRLSITMEVDFCLEAVEEALARHGRPEIFNTGHGSQFTGAAFTGLLTENGIQISMDGRGSWRDNVFVERLWRSVKYEEVYLRAYDSVGEARASLGWYLDFYNRRRPHSSLDALTPEQAYFAHLPQHVAA
jgi:putative transposase